MTQKTRYIGTFINCPFAKAYDFLSKPETMPLWAAGLGEDFYNEQGEWYSKSAEGVWKLRFSPKNTFGILDHWVTDEEGTVMYNPMRLVPHNLGCEIVFTLFHRNGMTDEQFEDDANAITEDFATLKTLLEQPAE